MRWTLAILLCHACSYAGVNGPTGETTPTTIVSCTDSDVFPAIDSLIGVLAIAGSVGGEIADHLATNPIDHFELYIGLPALVTGIIYLMSASSGTDKVEACQAAKQQQVRGCDDCPAVIP